MSHSTLETLPGWELPILQGASDGLSDLRIGAQLYLSKETVKTYMRRLCRRVGARNRAHAVRLGFERGWLLPHVDCGRRHTGLTASDLAVLDLASKGLTYPRIGAHMGISAGAAKERARKVFRILGVANKAHAVRRGFDRGLLPVSSQEEKEGETDG